MVGKKVINEECHQAFLSADRGENTIIISPVVLMKLFYLFEKTELRSI